jgi:hypothetical protein
VTTEVYHKRYGAYPVSSQIPSLSLANIGDTFAVRDVLFPMVSLGTGAATGIELLAERRSRAGARWSGQANLALSRARHAGTDGVRRPGSFDYPIVLNVVAIGHLTGRWDLSIRMAYLSARPYTPIDLEAARQAGRAVFDTSRVNAERSSDYFRADVRVDRLLTLNGRSVRVFGGLQNVTNRRNIAGFTWDRRNNALRTLDQLGLFPILGLDWQF